VRLEEVVLKAFSREREAAERALNTIVTAAAVNAPSPEKLNKRPVERVLPTRNKLSNLIRKVNSVKPKPMQLTQANHLKLEFVKRVKMCCREKLEKRKICVIRELHLERFQN